MTADFNIQKLFAGGLAALVLGWGTLITATVWTVTGLVPQIESMGEQLERNSNWISEWPQNGELAADVRQSKDIEFILQEQAETQEAILELQVRLRAMELTQAQSGS